MKPEAFVKLYAPAVKQACPAGWRIVLAHAAFESGWGVAMPAVKGHNLFNITRTAGDPNPVIVAGDLEYAPSGGPPRQITQRFAKYASVSEGLQHYLKFIARKRYQPASDCLVRGDMPGFVSALYKGGYFTLPLSQYLASMASVLERIEALTKE